MRVEQKLIVSLLTVLWINIVQCKPEMVSKKFHFLYAKLDPNAPYEEKKKFYPVDYDEPYGPKKKNKCTDRQFLDRIVGDDRWDRYCFHIPQLPDSNEGARIIVDPNEGYLYTCVNHFVCYRWREKSPDISWRCETIFGNDGVCIKANPVAYVLSDTYLKLSADIKYEERRQYFPVDYKSVTETTPLKQCSMNKECGDGQFCGTVFDYSREWPRLKNGTNPYSERNIYCYEIPTLPDFHSMPRIIPVLPDKLEMELCDNTVRCKADESWRCDIDTGMKYVKEEPELQKAIYDGICVKEPPVAFVFSENYKTISNDVLYEERKKYFPADYPGLTQNTVLKNCLINSDCGDGQFCEAVFDSTDNAPKQNMNHCFLVPQFPDSNGLPRLVVSKPTEKGLVLCEIDIECEMWKCYLASGQKFIDEKTNKIYNGVCEKAPPVAYVYSETYLNLSSDTAYEEKKKYLSAKYENVDDQCTSHSNCEDNQFCGDILDFTTKLPKNKFYCFDLPHLPETNNEPRVAGRPATNNLALCNENSECESGELWDCDLKTGLKFAGEVGGKRVLYNGVCIMVPPVALLFSDTYRNLPADVSYEEKKKYFAVDFVRPMHSSTLKTCSTNKECDEGQFCDQVLNFLNNLAKAGRKNCFKAPKIDAPFQESTKITIPSDKPGLMLCNGPTDCDSDQFCNTETGQKYVKSKTGDSETAALQGICMKAEICKVNEHNEQFKWSYGASPTNSKISCDSDVDCAGTRDTGDTVFQSYCVINKAYNNVNLCCHRETQPCKLGKLVGPEVRCGKNELFKDGTFAECNGGLEKMGGQGEKADKWCDEANNQCCQSSTDDKIQYCPDGQTPLFNEPKCQNYDEMVPNSGECVGKTGSTCKNGHCCPDVKIDAQGKLIRNKHSYTTNHPCIPGIRPSQFPAGYCEPESGKVVIFGELSPLNETLTRWPEESPKKCQTDSDCSTDNSTICIYNEEPYCYYNPMRHVPIQSSNLVIIIVIVIGIIILIAVIVGVTVWMLMKKKKKTIKPAKSLESKSVQTPSKSIESKVSAEIESGMKTPTGNVQ